jgi:hypothetical protein
VLLKDSRDPPKEGWSSGEGTVNISGGEEEKLL